MLIRWPLVWRKRMLDKLARAAEEKRESERRLLNEIEDIKRSVARIADRCSMLRWFHDQDHYEMRLRMDPRAFGTGYREDRRLMAEMIARKVEAEIASCQFIKSAADEEKRGLRGPSFI